MVVIWGALGTGQWPETNSALGPPRCCSDSGGAAEEPSGLRKNCRRHAARSPNQAAPYRLARFEKVIRIPEVLEHHNMLLNP